MFGRLAVVLAASLVLSGAIAGQPADLPPRDVFLRETADAIGRSQALWHRYAYRERRTELHLNPFGRMGTGVIEVFEVWPASNPKLTRRRLIERDGVPVPKQELDRQDAEYLARTTQAGSDSVNAGGRRRDEDLLAKRRAEMIVDDVANTLRFDLARREFHDGRPAIVVTFAPRPGAKPITREGQFTRAFRGEIRIDEASHEVTDVHATAIDDISYGGFIAKVYKGTEAVLERREIAQGVWMPTRVTLRGDIRALFRKARMDHVVEWSDYRLIPE